MNESKDIIFFKESHLVNKNSDNSVPFQPSIKEPKMSFGQNKDITEERGWSSPSDYKNVMNFGDYFSKSKNLQKKFSEKFPKDQLDTFEKYI